MAAHRRAVLAAALAAMLSLLGVAAFFLLRAPYSVRQFRQGVAYYEAGRDESALDCLNASLRIEQQSREALVARAHVFQHQGDFRLAFADYEAADRLAAAPEIAACQGFCLSQLRQDEQAVVFYRRAIQSGGDSAAVLNNLGYSWFLLNQLEDAESCLRRAVQADETLQAAHHNLVLVFLQRALAGKAIPPEAFVHARRALETGPQSGDLYRDLAFLHAVAVKQDAAAAQTAIGCVAKAVALGMDPEVFRSNPLFLDLKQDPAFQAAILVPVTQRAPAAVQVIDPLSRQ
jgi:Tfp pilus assembly protein PilF